MSRHRKAVRVRYVRGRAGRAARIEATCPFCATLCVRELRVDGELKARLEKSCEHYRDTGIKQSARDDVRGLDPIRRARFYFDDGTQPQVMRA